MYKIEVKYSWMSDWVLCRDVGDTPFITLADASMALHRQIRYCRTTDDCTEESGDYACYRIVDMSTGEALRPISRKKLGRAEEGIAQKDARRSTAASKPPPARLHAGDGWLLTIELPDGTIAFTVFDASFPGYEHGAHLVESGKAVSAKLSMVKRFVEVPAPARPAAPKKEPAK